MKKLRLPIVFMMSGALVACTATNDSKSACADEGIMLGAADVQGEWRLESYRIDCESTQFDVTSDYKLSFSEPDNTFGLTTDCNMISGDFGIAGDTVRFKNVLVTEMACDDMTVEQNMLRMFNDSTAYAVCYGDTLAFTAPYIGSAMFIKCSDEEESSVRDSFIGVYMGQNDGSSLQICDSANSGLRIKINLFRLTNIDDGIGKVIGGTLTFAATDAAGNPIKGIINTDGDNVTLVFTESTWEYLPNGTTYHFKRNEETDTQYIIYDNKRWSARR